MAEQPKRARPATPPPPPPPPPSEARGEREARVEPVRFDERLSRLEALAAELERGDLSLEAAMERYQQGIELLRLCQQELAGFQGRVEELSKAAADTLAELGSDAAGGTGGSGRSGRSGDSEREP